MAVIITSEPTAAQEQYAVYNDNIGGNLNRKAQFSVPSGISWCVIGTVLNDVVVPSDVTNTLIPAIEALTEVTSVNGDQLWGQAPATIEAVDHEAIVYVSSIMITNIGSGADTFKVVSKNSESVILPDGKKWCLFAMVTPSELDPTKIIALEAAVEGVAGITVCEHLIDGTVSDRVSGNAALTIWGHTRIEPIVV